MHDLTAPSRPWRLALLLAVLALVLSTLPARAATSVSIEARPLLDGRYEVGGWAAVAVTLVNEGEPTEGYLAAETRSGVMRRFVEMPAGARKVVTLYVQPEAFQRRITVRYDEPNGVAEVTVELRAFESSTGQSAVVGDGAGTVRPQLSAVQDGRPEPLALTVADLPERPEAMSGLESIVWAADSTALTDAHRRGLARWLADGGRLVVLGGADWQARTAGFADLLPLDGLAAVDGVPQAELAAWAGADEPPITEATAVSGTLRPDALALVAADDGTPLISMRPVGGGQVVLIGSDLATDAHRGWAGAASLWSRLLPSGAAIEQFWGVPMREELENAMSQALGNLPSLSVPPAELLLAVIVAYILLIGPISYVVLRRLDRRELAWITAPLLVVLFTACSYGIGNTLKGGDVIVNQISVIRTSTAGGTATVQTYAGIFSPQRETFDLTVEADALMAQLRPANVPNARPTSAVVVDQGEPARLHGLGIGVFGFEGIRADAVVEHEPALDVSWSQEDDGDLVGTVTNVGDEALSDVAYISTGGGTRIGDLGPGESKTFTPRGAFNGGSASEAVYGFGGFGDGQGERTTALRRSVIDSLVGFGGFWAPGVDLSAQTGRGPYLIGWRESPGPVPVVVEGLQAQQLNHSVEVLAVRPTPAGGEVTVSPGQMSVSVIERDGDVGDGGPGTVFLQSGSAVFSIALPLEMSGLQPEEVEIVAGPDAHMVIAEEGGFGGFWPPGVTIELRHAQTGEWMHLGDLNQQSRFSVDDVSAAMSSAGRIEVRVSAEELNPNFGQNTFFVSARVRGVLDR